VDRRATARCRLDAWSAPVSRRFLAGLWVPWRVPPRRSGFPLGPKSNLNSKLAASLRPILDKSDPSIHTSVP